MFKAILSQLIVAASVAGIAPAAIAQHIEASTADTQAIKAAHERFSQDWNKHDVTAIAALFTSDSLLVTPTGIAVGSQEIESSFKKLFDRVASATDFSEPLDHVEMVAANAAVVAGSWTINSLKAKGYWADVFERQGQGWMIRIHSYSITPEPSR